MTHGQHQTAAVLGLYVALQIVGVLSLIGWEFYAIAGPGMRGQDATISRVIQMLYAQQPWPFMAVTAVALSLLAALWGHFFAQDASVYEDMRKRMKKGNQ